MIEARVDPGLAMWARLTASAVQGPFARWLPSLSEPERTRMLELAATVPSGRRLRYLAALAAVAFMVMSVAGRLVEWGVGPGAGIVSPGAPFSLRKAVEFLGFGLCFASPVTGWIAGATLRRRDLPAVAPIDARLADLRRAEASRIAIAFLGVLAPLAVMAALRGSGGPTQDLVSNLCAVLAAISAIALSCGIGARRID